MFCNGKYERSISLRQKLSKGGKLQSLLLAYAPHCPIVFFDCGPMTALFSGASTSRLRLTSIPFIADERIATLQGDPNETALGHKLFYAGRCSILMLPESVLNTLAGGVIGIASGLSIWIIRDWIENRRRRKHLIDAIDSTARSSMLPPLMSAYSGRTDFFSPAAQFQPTFWRDLALLGTETQMMVVDFFSMTNSVTSRSSPSSKELLDALDGMRRDVMKLLELERAGKRQNMKP